MMDIELPPSEAGIQETLKNARQNLDAQLKASKQDQRFERFILHRLFEKHAPQPAVLTSLSKLAQAIRATPANGVDEVSTVGRFMPGIHVRWQEKETIVTFAAALQAVPIDESLPASVRALAGLLEAANEVNASAERVVEFVEYEQARIDRINASASDKNKPLEPMSLASRDIARRVLDASESLLEKCGDPSTSMDVQISDVANACFVATIARAIAPLTVGKIASEQVHAVKTLASCVEELITLHDALINFTSTAENRSLELALRERVAIVERYRSPFLELPAREGKELIHKLVESLGRHTLLSASTLGALIALCAYIKAGRELQLQGLSALTMINGSSAANIAIALAAPFILLLAATVALAHTWYRTLKIDHRRTLRFLLGVVFWLAALIGLYGAFRNLTPATEQQVAESVWSVLFCLGAIPAFALAVAGRIKGIGADDLIQRSVLALLRFAASTVGLIVMLSIVGTTLVLDNSVAVLFPRTSPIGEAATNLKVLELNSGEHMLIASSYSRLDGEWLIKRAPDAKFALSEAGQSRALLFEDWPIVFVAVNKVACIRPVRSDEFSQTRLQLRCVQVPAAPAIPASNSIAQFAVERFGCAVSSFEREAVAEVMQFENDQPGAQSTALDPAALVPTRRWQVPASSLMAPALSGVPEQSKGTDRSAWLIEELSRDSSSTLWILGFASSPGVATHNLNLSQRRAHVLRELLMPSDLMRSLPATNRIKSLALGDSVLAGVEPGKEARRAIAFLCRHAQKAAGQSAA